MDTRSLPIGPEEAFILSRVDGHSNEAELALASGIELAQLDAVLERLAGLGAVEFVAPDAPPRRPTPGTRPASRPSQLLAHPVIEAATPPAGENTHPAAALYDPAELDEEVELELPRKRQILDLFYRLDSLTHYALLEVASSADKKDIKDAYFRAVSVFHPDRYFGKSLGGFKPKLERIFERFTLAHDTLTKKRSREEYDAYLGLQRGTDELSRILADERARAAELAAVRRQIEEEARVSERAERAHPESLEGAPSEETVRVVRALDPEERRRALARKLGRGLRPSSAPPSLAPPDGAATRERVAEELRRRYDERVRAVRDQQVDRYLKIADQAIVEGQPVSAANALRIAASLAPADVTLKEKLAVIEERATRQLSESYLEQATYEEKNRDWSSAARSYERASTGNDSPRLLERAAYCLLEANGDLRKAGELCRQAVQAAPELASFRVTLARVYLAAKMRQSALSEFERAASLAPDDDTIKDWIRRIKRDEV
ncbi:MAG: DnaJ domain-containing protein [Polyangiaceae bacterium]|nr:DnaJ domain-containing protein [Polyangiaceae bacterium]